MASMRIGANAPYIAKATRLATFLSLFVSRLYLRLSRSLQKHLPRRFVCGLGFLFYLYVASITASAFEPTLFFQERAAAPCPVTKTTAPTYKACRNDTCNMEVKEVILDPQSTNKSKGNCGFLAEGWPFARCQDLTEHYDRTHGADKYNIKSADGYRSGSCKWPWSEASLNFTCEIELLRRSRCMAEVCGVERAGHPIEWASCSHFSFGIKEEIFTRAWNSGDSQSRSALSLLLLLDENRESVSLRLALTIVDWLAAADLYADHNLTSVSEIVAVLEESPSSLTEARFTDIIGQ